MGNVVCNVSFKPAMAGPGRRDTMIIGVLEGDD